MASLAKYSKHAKSRVTDSFGKVTGDGLDKKILKATPHDKTLTKEKYYKELFGVSDLSPAELATKLIKRLETNDWVVVLKTLMLFHRLLKEAGARFIAEMKHYVNHFALTKFRDTSSSQAHIQTNFIKAYAFFIQEKLRILQEISVDFEKSFESLKNLPVSELLTQLPYLQTHVDAMLSIKNNLNAINNPVSANAYSLILKDSFKLYNALNFGTINLLEHYFTLHKKEAQQGLEIYKKFTKQTEQIIKLYEDSKRFTNSELPQLSKAPPSLTQALEDYIKEFDDPSKPKKTVSDPSDDIPVENLSTPRQDYHQLQGFQEFAAFNQQITFQMQNFNPVISNYQESGLSSMTPRVPSSSDPFSSQQYQQSLSAPSLGPAPPMSHHEQNPFNSPQQNQGQSSVPFTQQQNPPFNQLSQPPFNPSNQTPFNQPQQATFNQPQQTPFNQQGQTPFNQQGQTPFNQQGSAPFNQQAQTPFNQQPFNQTNQTPFNQTPFNQPNQTPFNQQAHASFTNQNTPFNQQEQANQTPFNLPQPQNPPQQAFNQSPSSGNPPLSPHPSSQTDTQLQAPAQVVPKKQDQIPFNQPAQVGQQQPSFNQSQPLNVGQPQPQNAAFQSFGHSNPGVNGFNQQFFPAVNQAQPQQQFQGGQQLNQQPQFQNPQAVFNSQAGQPFNPQGQAGPSFNSQTGQPFNSQGGQPFNPQGAQPFNPQGGQAGQSFNSQAGQPFNHQGGQPFNPQGAQPHAFNNQFMNNSGLGSTGLPPGFGSIGRSAAKTPVIGVAAGSPQTKRNAPVVGMVAGSARPTEGFSSQQGFQSNNQPLIPQGGQPFNPQGAQPFNTQNTQGAQPFNGYNQQVSNHQLNANASGRGLALNMPPQAQPFNQSILSPGGQIMSVMSPGGQNNPNASFNSFSQNQLSGYVPAAGTSSLPRTQSDSSGWPQQRPQSFMQQPQGFQQQQQAFPQQAFSQQPQGQGQGYQSQQGFQQQQGFQPQQQSFQQQQGFSQQPQGQGQGFAFPQ